MSNRLGHVRTQQSNTTRQSDRIGSIHNSFVAPAIFEVTDHLQPFSRFDLIWFFLFCFVLFCFVLFCFVLFCFVLFCFVLFCFVLFCFVLFCFVLFCFVQIKSNQIKSNQIKSNQIKSNLNNYIFCFILSSYIGLQQYPVEDYFPPVAGKTNPILYLAFFHSSSISLLTFISDVVVVSMVSVGDGDVSGTEDIHVRVPPRPLFPKQQGMTFPLSFSHLIWLSTVYECLSLYWTCGCVSPGDIYTSSKIQLAVRMRDWRVSFVTSGTPPTSTSLGTLSYPPPLPLLFNIRLIIVRD